MNPAPSLSFKPSEIRDRCWVAETPDTRYTIYESLSGFVVNYQRIVTGATGLTPAPQRLRHFFGSFADAARACSEHHASPHPGE